MMQIKADLGKRIINLVVDSGEAAATFIKQAKEQSAFMIAIPGQAQPFDLFQCKLIVSGSFETAPGGTGVAISVQPQWFWLRCASRLGRQTS
jgi:hypothetical protein